MLWQLWIWYPGLANWLPAGSSPDGVNDNIRQSTMRGLLRGVAKNGVVFAYHAQSKRGEKYYSPDGEFLGRVGAAPKETDYPPTGNPRGVPSGVVGAFTVIEDA